MDADAASRPGPVVRVLVGLLTVYRRWISPLFGPSCRFYPTCSAYAVTALSSRGLVRGTVLTLVRLAKCGPWHPGGVDHVPPRPGGSAGAGAPTTAPTFEEPSC